MSMQGRHSRGRGFFSGRQLCWSVRSGVAKKIVNLESILVLGHYQGCREGSTIDDGNKGCDGEGCDGDGNCKSDNTMAMVVMMVVKPWQ